MSRFSLRRSAGIVLASVTVVAAWGRALAAPVPIGRIEVVGEGVERSTNGRDWQALPDAALVRTGDRIRTGERSLARFGNGWVHLVVSPGSEIEIPSTAELSIRLERGRIEQTSEGSDIFKVRTRECLVRGKGQLVVARLDKDTTVVSARLGRFRVDAAGRMGALEPGFGLLVRRGQAPPPPRALLPAPDGLTPSADPVYVERDAPVSLEWRSAAQAHQVELIAVGSDLVVMQTIVGASPTAITIPWPGTYRWRVIARDAQGMESVPSRTGMLCVPGW